MQFPQAGVPLLVQLQAATQGFPCEHLKIGDIDRDFSLTIANGNVRSCHSERSEESQIGSAGQFENNNQIYVASLNMT